jgi:hypothetical protein
MSEDSQYLGEYAIGDGFPFPYFVFTEKQFNITNQRFDTVALDPADYTAIKFSARHENNNNDFDDHASDDIYANLTSDGGGVYHYEWALSPDDLDKVGRWAVRIEFERISGEKFHADQEWYFDVVHKTSGKFGDH